MRSLLEYVAAAELAHLQSQDVLGAMPEPLPDDLDTIELHTGELEIAVREPHHQMPNRCGESTLRTTTNLEAVQS